MQRPSMAFASALALLCACTPLRPLDPSLESGVGRDAGRVDAFALDAPGLDAPREDVGTRSDAWSDDAPSALDASCTDGARCVGSMLRTCERGIATDTVCSIGCLTVPAPHCAELVPSNIPGTLLTDGTLDYLVAGDFELDTTRCSDLSLAGLTLGPIDQEGDGAEVCAMAVGSLTIPEGTTMRVTGSRPFVLAAARNVTIAGTLDASATWRTAGPGGGAAGTSSAPARGPAPGGRAMRSSMSTTDDSGGGGGGMCAAGGDGGDGPPSVGGTGGPSLPSTALIPLVGGSGGGAGSGAGVGTLSGAGGAGGGAVQITAGGSIVVRGSILASGGAGQTGGEVMTAGTIAGGGGGGGSGGGILLEAPTVTLDAGSRLVTTGGGGGAGSGPAFIETDAEDGADLVRRARGGMGGGSYGASGGDSGGGDTPEGLPGMDQTMMGNGGGGGGSAGCIVLRSSAAPSTTGALLSPSAGGLTTLPLMTR